MQEDFNDPEQDAREARAGAERLQSDAGELVWFLVDAGLLDTALAGIMFDAIMAWATDAAEHRGALHERQESLATLIDEAPRLVDLADRDAQLRTRLRKAIEAITTAAGQLSSVSHDDHEALSLAIQAFNQAVGELYRFSGDQLRLADDHVNAARTERVAIGEPYLRDVRRGRFSEDVDQARQALDDAERMRSEVIGPRGRATRHVLGYQDPDDLRRI